jgi:hypothetical protein
MSDKKQTQYCGSAKELGDSLLIDLNLNQLKDILSKAENAQFRNTYTTKDGTVNEVLKLKAVKRKEVQGFSTHFLCLNDYVKGETKQDLPF